MTWCSWYCCVLHNIRYFKWSIRYYEEPITNIWMVFDHFYLVREIQFVACVPPLLSYHWFNNIRDEPLSLSLRTIFEIFVLKITVDKCIKWINSWFKNSEILLLGAWELHYHYWNIMDCPGSPKSSRNQSFSATKFSFAVTSRGCIWWLQWGENVTRTIPLSQ